MLFISNYTRKITRSRDYLLQPVIFLDGWDFTHVSHWQADATVVMRQGVLLLSRDGMLVHHGLTSPHNGSLIPFYSRVKRGTLRVKCIAQEHNTRNLERPDSEHLNHWEWVRSAAVRKHIRKVSYTLLKSDNNSMGFTAMTFTPLFHSVHLPQLSTPEDIH